MYDQTYGYTPFLVRAGIVACFALFGIFNVVHGFYYGRRMRAAYNRIPWYLGSFILAAGSIVWPPVYFLYGDATNGVAIVVAAGATIALGASLAGNAMRRERWGFSDD